MPELPEVETIKLGLQKKVIGLKITKIQINSPKSFQDEKGKPFDYAQGLRGKKVLNVWRKAKILGIDLGGINLLIHLKMTGQVIYDPSISLRAISRFVGGHPTSDMRDKMPNSHTRVTFEFSDGSKLYFNDQRCFGWIKVIENLKLETEKLLGKLGPEPLEKEFSWEVLKTNLLKHKSMPIKVALMDQSVVSGVGNIYASEACFNAEIDPIIKVKDLTDAQFKKLHQGLIKSLQDGIKYGGASRAHFVYGKDKHPCKICKGEIKKIQLAGRGTFFCSSCQK